MGELADRVIREYEQEVREAERLEEVYNARLKSKKRPPAKDRIDQVVEDLLGFAKSNSSGDQDKTSHTSDDQGPG